MSPRVETIRLATRSSDLALEQARQVKERLESRRRSVELVEVETTGDQIEDELIHRLGTTGAFVRSLDRKVLDGELDAAVHSMKDMPTNQPEELVVAGVLERAPAGDVLVTPAGMSLDELPPGAVIGTASLRRQAQVLAARPDVTVEGLRGNVDTRVKKLLAPTLQQEKKRRLQAADDEGADDEGADDEGADDEGANDQRAGETPDDEDLADEKPTEQAGKGAESAVDVPVSDWLAGLAPIEREALALDFETVYDGICLAEAGLTRSGLLADLEYERLQQGAFVPAPAQGAIAVVTRDGALAARVYDIIDHPPTRVEVTVERAILGELGGGCVAPVGIHARLQGEVVATTVRVLSRDGSEEIRRTRELPVGRHAKAATKFAKKLEDEGATELIERARRTQPDQAKREG